MQTEHGTARRSNGSSGEYAREEMLQGIRPNLLDYPDVVGIHERLIIGDHYGRAHGCDTQGNAQF